MKKTRLLTTIAALGLVSALSPLAVSAAVVSEVNPTDQAQQTVILNKEEAVVPTFTVSVPATVEIGQESA